MSQPLSPWVQDQRRIRRLRAKVRAERARAERWMSASNAGWKTARELRDHIKKTGHATKEELDRIDALFGHEPF